MKKKISRATQRIKILAVVLVMVVGTYLLTRVDAAAAQIYISPSSTTKTVGNTFTAQVRINTTSAINAAFVNLAYNGQGLQVISIARGSSFPNQNAQTQHNASSTGTGTIKMQSTRNNSATGNLHFATITFKARKSGTYGFYPQTTSSLINYPSNTVSYTVSGGLFTFNNPAPPPQPTPTPKPKPVPKPTPKPSTPTPKPTPSTKPKAVVPKTTSTPSASNLRISHFVIGGLDYRSATLTWKTNKPSTSKVNYGETPQDMSQEVSNSRKTTNHKLVLKSGDLRAGTLYAVRISSNDGRAPVTLDGEFVTRSIPIVVKVVDTQEKPIAGVTVAVGSVEAVTDEAGEASLAVAEGSVTIIATKDNMSSELVAEVAIPAAEDSIPQSYNVQLDKTADAAVPAEGGNPLMLILLLLFGLGLAAVVFILWRRRKQSAYNVPMTDPYDVGVLPSQAPNNAHPPAPISPPPMSSGSQDYPHYASLSELVKQDTAQRNPRSSNDEVNDMFSPLDRPAPPAPQQPATPPPQPRRDELPVPQVPQPQPVAEPAKPSAPPEPSPKPEPQPEPTPELPRHKDAEVDPTDNSLRINHDD
jgi:hypothetical protein